MNTLELVVDLGEDSDLERALAFYEQALTATAGERLDPDRLVCQVGSTRLLLTRRPVAPDRFYQKGVTPRLELMVEGVDEWLRHALDAGAELRVRLRADGTRCQSEDEPAIYAQILDPHGHLWAFVEQKERP